MGKMPMPRGMGILPMKVGKHGVGLSFQAMFGLCYHQLRSPIRPEPQVPSMKKPTHDTVAASATEQKQGIHPASAGIEKRYGANLPHWTKDGAWNSVTFRLFDSVPQ